MSAEMLFRSNYLKTKLSCSTLLRSKNASSYHVAVNSKARYKDYTTKT